MNEILTIPALSLWQPHAQAIALGIKVYETRSWPTKYRGPLAIHAAKKLFRPQEYPSAWVLEARARLTVAGGSLQELQYGTVVCVVDVVDCVPTDTIPPLFWGDFRPGRWAFSLERVRRLKQEIPVAGRQGFFNVTIPASFCEVNP